MGRNVLEKFLDQVDVGHDHAAAAVALQTELVHRVTVAKSQFPSTQQLRPDLLASYPSGMF